MYTDEEEEEEEEEVEEEEEEEEEPQHGHSHRYFHVSPMGEAHLVADVIHGGKALSFLHGCNPCGIHVNPPEESRNGSEAPGEDVEESQSSEQFTAQDSLGHESEECNQESREDEIPARHSDSVRRSVGWTVDAQPPPVMLDRFRNDLANSSPIYDGKYILPVPYEIIT